MFVRMKHFVCWMVSGYLVLSRLDRYTAQWFCVIPPGGALRWQTQRAHSNWPLRSWKKN
jgi:hypothetical protein